MIPAIISGGSGTRLWPISRSKLPKQFCEIFSESLQALTLRRIAKLGTPWTVTAESLKDQTVRTLKDLDLPCDQVIYEPIGRNTAPAIAALCFHLDQQGFSEEVIGVFPADHLVEDNNAFYEAVGVAEKAAMGGQIVTLGIHPDHPSTGFGYIEISRPSNDFGRSTEAYGVRSFHEKPNLEAAKSFLETGTFYWNAGIFIFRIDAMIRAFKTTSPKLWESITELSPDLSNLPQVYESIESISIDCAVMERLDSERISCVPCDIGWSDVGSWDAVVDLLKSDHQDSVIAVDAKNNFAFSHLEKQYAFVGVDNIVLIDTADATLVTQRGATQKVKTVSDVLRERGSSLADDHVFEARPWGRFEVLKSDNCFKSKIIQVLPQQQLSLQSHARREEHWVVTKGKGEVVINDNTLTVQRGSYVNIPLTAKHRMRNTGTEPLEFVEVQIGDYFGEDDIVRYQDDYQRQ